MTRTATRIQADEDRCPSLVEHFDSNPIIDDPQPTTQPLPVIEPDEDDDGDETVAKIETEVVKMLKQALLWKRFTSRISFRKGRQTIHISINGYMFDYIKDKVSCKDVQALVADKVQLQALLQAAAQKACSSIEGVTFIALIPSEPSKNSIGMDRIDRLDLEVDVA